MDSFFVKAVDTGTSYTTMSCYHVCLHLGLLIYKQQPSNTLFNQVLCLPSFLYRTRAQSPETIAATPVKVQLAINQALCFHLLHLWSVYEFVIKAPVKHCDSYRLFWFARNTWDIHYDPVSFSSNTVSLTNRDVCFHLIVSFILNITSLISSLNEVY